jgi:hypothetical protein
MKSKNKEGKMPKYRTIELTGSEKAALIEIRDYAEKPYLRERASAILQVADGRSGRWVALNGLLRRRVPDTIYAWLDRYESEGLAGLTIRKGRGRPPAYEP